LNLQAGIAVHGDCAAEGGEASLNALIEEPSGLAAEGLCLFVRSCSGARAGLSGAICPLGQVAVSGPVPARRWVPARAVRNTRALRRQALVMHTPLSPRLRWVNQNQQQGESAMSFMSEFREFALKGNVVDLAVGVIIGGAFGKIVDSMVGDVIMPIVGAVVGKIDFSNLYLVLGSVPAGVANNLADLKKAGVPVLAWGNFITIAINFAILAFVIFVMIKQINRLKRAEPAAPAPEPVTPEDVVLLREIRDSLRK
jgi:large conductance mechanosensitive channel